jgi:hypothetical protein
VSIPEMNRLLELKIQHGNDEFYQMRSRTTLPQPQEANKDLVTQKVHTKGGLVYILGNGSKDILSKP